eukprot:2451424-Rhodomonas_salina.1
MCVAGCLVSCSFARVVVGGTAKGRGCRQTRRTGPGRGAIELHECLLVGSKRGVELLAELHRDSDHLRGGDREIGGKGDNLLGIRARELSTGKTEEATK